VNLKVPIVIFDELSESVIRSTGNLDLASGEIFDVQLAPEMLAEEIQVAPHDRREVHQGRRFLAAQSREKFPEGLG